MPIPKALQDITSPTLITPLPSTNTPKLQEDLPTLIYNFYNLDPLWRSDLPANRILLLEPSVFDKYPVAQKSIDFCIALATANIPNVQVYVAEFAELRAMVSGTIYFKEHPLNQYTGVQDSRAWLTSVEGNYRSFFAFWKQCKKELFSA
jgi:deoxyribodipyrimidine photo-lyase